MKRKCEICGATMLYYPSEETICTDCVDETKLSIENTPQHEWGMEEDNESDDSDTDVDSEEIEDVEDISIIDEAVDRATTGAIGWLDVQLYHMGTRSQHHY